MLNYEINYKTMLIFVRGAEKEHGMNKGEAYEMHIKSILDVYEVQMRCIRGA
jgi:hypothetical protein